MLIVSLVGEVLFSRKNKKNISKCRQLKFYPAYKMLVTKHNICSGLALRGPDSVKPVLSKHLRESQKVVA